MDKAEEQYIRDEWHGHTEDGTECDCYIALLKAKDKRIAELEAELARMYKRRRRETNPLSSERARHPTATAGAMKGR